MKIKPSINEAVWMAVGSIALLAVLVVLTLFRSGEDPDEQLKAKTHRLALVSQIRWSLESAAEAEKSAVLAITDEDSQKFADQARAATAMTEKNRRELESVLPTAEWDLFAEFSRAFAELQRIDQEVLELAVKNTNLKAFSLAFGPAAAAIKEFDAALARLPADDMNVVRLASDARIAALRLAVLLPPHIAEQTEPKMDEMEAQMTTEDQEVRRSLNALATQPSLASNADLKTADVSYQRFSELRAQILKLSRENTNVRSLTLSLTQKRKALAACEDALVSLQEAIQNEVIASKPVGRAIMPR